MNERPWPARMRLVRIRADRNEWRFYDLSLWPCLWEGVLLARQWGRIGQPPTRTRLDHYPSIAAARAAWAALLRRKRRRGYRRVFSRT